MMIAIQMAATNAGKLFRLTFMVFIALDVQVMIKLPGKHYRS